MAAWKHKITGIKKAQEKYPLKKVAVKKAKPNVLRNYNLSYFLFLGCRNRLFQSFLVSAGLYTVEPG